MGPMRSLVGELVLAARAPGQGPRDVGALTIRIGF